MQRPDLTEANLRAWRAKGLSARTIADHTGHSSAAVERALRRYGIHRLSAISEISGPLPSHAELESLVKQGLSYQKIGAHYGKSEDWARYQIRARGLAEMKEKHKSAYRKGHVDVDELRRLCEAGVGIRNLAAHFNSRENSVKNTAYRHNITIPKQDPQVKMKLDNVGDREFNQRCAEFSRNMGGYVPGCAAGFGRWV